MILKEKQHIQRKMLPFSHRKENVKEKVMMRDAGWSR